MKFLVTGSTGLIGRQVIKDLVEQKFDVYSCYYKSEPEFGIHINLDLTNENDIVNILNTIQPDIVIHLAAMTDVELCESQKDLATLINTNATKILARESAKYNAFFIYVSTDYVFNGKEGMKKENDITDPLGFYGKSKLQGEIALNDLDITYSIIRTSTPFGIHPKKKSFPIWVKENLESNNEIPILMDQFTSPTFVPNLSKMIIEIAIKKITGIIHLASATRISRYEFAKMIAEKLNLDKTLLKPTNIDEMKWKAQRPKDSSLDVSKATKILNEKPQTIQQSLDLFLLQIKK